MVQEWLDIAKEKGYVKPTWFQGQYNLAVRTYEQTLFPLLRSEGIHFAAYSPLGGGFLNGNLRPGKTTGTRFISHAAAAMSRNCTQSPVFLPFDSSAQTLTPRGSLRPSSLARIFRQSADPV